MSKLNETQYRQLLRAALSSENAPNISEDKILDMLDFYNANYPRIKSSLDKFILQLTNMSVEEIINNSQETIDLISNYADKIERVIEEFWDEVGYLDDYLTEIGGELYQRSNELYNKYKKMYNTFNDATLISDSIKKLAETIYENEINLMDNLEAPIEIDETFASKAQAKYFYAKAGDKNLSKAEREKWGNMAHEFSSKTNFKNLPAKA